MWAESDRSLPRRTAPGPKDHQAPIRDPPWTCCGLAVDLPQTCHRPFQTVQPWQGSFGGRPGPRPLDITELPVPLACLECAVNKVQNKCCNAGRPFTDSGVRDMKKSWVIGVEKVEGVMREFGELCLVNFG